LTKEHIVPESLSGTWIIQGACSCCAKKSNEEYESLVLRSDMVRTMRDFLKLQRKRHKEKPPIKMPPLFRHGTASKAKLEKTDYLSASRDVAYPRLFVMLDLEPAMQLIGSNAASPLDRRPIRLWLRNLETITPGPVVMSDPAVIANAYISTQDLLLTMDMTTKERSISIRQRFPLLKFMRMLAKTAYCFAVAEHGFERYDGSDIQMLVRGERTDYANFVGGSFGGERLTNRYLHHLEFRKRGELQTVIVHLFSSYDAPAYEVVLGTP